MISSVLPVSQTTIELARLRSHHPESLVLTPEVEEKLISVLAGDAGVERPLVINA